MISQRTILAGMEVFHQALGDVFQITLPGFKPIVFAGPEANRFVLVSNRQDMLWRVEGDPVVDVLHHGVLIEDDDDHDHLRRMMNPSFTRRSLETFVPSMVRFTDQISDTWPVNQTLDMLVEMRKIALLILMDTLFAVDVTPDLDQLIPSILKTLKYISPGLWLVWRRAPRPGYQRALEDMDAYLYRIIKHRRQDVDQKDDLLSSMIERTGMNDSLIRDQLLTLLIAGHDTSTALLSWSLYLLGIHPMIMEQVRSEIDNELAGELPNPENIAQLTYLNQVIKETLRLYPPIHAGNRIAATDLEFNNYHIPAGSRILYSIYLTHRHPQHWPDPHRFDPQRFAPDSSTSPTPYAYLPFGGGPRNCIGGSFAQVESKAILARLFQKYDFKLLPTKVHPYMGATLEPHPGVMMKVTPRMR